MTENIKAIAFYLPQFHPIPENDEWWGKGFTEWTNVAKAVPLFPGHYQPHVPADLGFYDLRVPEVRAAQAELARKYGIHGFCYWHYWFNGRRLLHLPFDQVLASGEPDFPFCLAWANENWTRRWDGAEREVLLAQHYTTEDDLAHIRWMINAFRDRRYITIDGKPLLIVYRISHLPDPAAVARLWREEVKKAGFPGLYLCTTTGLAALNVDPRKVGFDAAVEFQPHWDDLPQTEPPPGNRILGKLFKNRVPRERKVFLQHNVRSYLKIAETMMALPDRAYKSFKCVIPGWDNSPRRKSAAHIFSGSDPMIYGRWLRHAFRDCLRRFKGDERIVFVNAWNEWAEGNHLEPDLKHGLRYLEETQAALQDSNGS